MVLSFRSWALFDYRIFPTCHVQFPTPPTPNLSIWRNYKRLSYKWEVWRVVKPGLTHHFLGKCLYQVMNVLFFSCSVDWKLRWLSFLSVLSVFVDFSFWMRLGEWYRCYYLYSVVCQQIWRNVLPLFFPRNTGVKKTKHYKLFISNPIVLFWRTKKKTTTTKQDVQWAATSLQKNFWKK